jgi:hypothetical protein
MGRGGLRMSRIDEILTLVERAKDFVETSPCVTLRILDNIEELCRAYLHEAAVKSMRGGASMLRRIKAVNSFIAGANFIDPANKYPYAAQTVTHYGTPYQAFADDYSLILLSQPLEGITAATEVRPYITDIFKGVLDAMPPTEALVHLDLAEIKLYQKETDTKNKGIKRASREPAMCGINNGLYDAQKILTVAGILGGNDMRFYALPARDKQYHKLYITSSNGVAAVMPLRGLVQDTPTCREFVPLKEVR